jgi:heme exporter protein A
VTPAPASSSDPTTPAPPLALRDVACRRGGRLLFEHLDLVVPAGGCTWLRGGNGRGKTSLLRIACGLARPEAGEVAWHPVADAPLYLGHASALGGELTTAEALDFLARVHGAAPTRAEVAGALEALGLPRRLHGAEVRRLSQGQRRRAALARLALAGSPALWLLDEPFDALDVDGVARVEGLVAAHRARGGAVLFTSHRPPGDLGGPAAEVDLDRLAVPAEVAATGVVP